MDVRLSNREQDALKAALEGFEGEVYVFGSRTDLSKKGGDIDILLKPAYTLSDPWRLKMDVTARFMKVLEQSIDVVVWDDRSIFCREAMDHAKRIDSFNA
jgi:predicted nucleotidyltransferase